MRLTDSAALRDGDAVGVVAAVTAGADIEREDKCGRNALLWAVRNSFQLFCHKLFLNTIHSHSVISGISMS